MNAGAAAALAAIDAAFGEPVLYSGGGLPQPTTLTVIWSDVAGDAFQGAGNTVRIITAEVQQADLPARPTKADRITRDGIAWLPIDVTQRDDIGKWEIVLERVV